MPTPLYVPRVNNNDDAVRLIRVVMKEGDRVEVGDIVAEVETDKASFTVEAEVPGFVLRVVPQMHELIEVGSVLLWVGASLDESIPEKVTPATPQTRNEPTVKAALLLTKYNLRAADVPASGARLTAQDVEQYIASRSLLPADERASIGAASGNAATVKGTLEPLTPDERGMLRTVQWQRQEAVPGYVELQYDAGTWDRFAADFQQRERLLINPLLSLMAYRLARVAAQNRRINSTIKDQERLVYECVNVGFTVQSETTLFLVVIENAATLTCREFVDRLGQLQRSALAHRLRAREASGATVTFSSMARWNVTRHMPILPPYTSLIVAHAAPSADGRGTLGATYDHRVLTGFEALHALIEVSRPEAVC
jgi:pyruvate dehydrogenase E2 component (dihydrolipoamide acetyltransferase)